MHHALSEVVLQHMFNFPVKSAVELLILGNHSIVSLGQRQHVLNGDKKMNEVNIDLQEIAFTVMNIKSMQVFD